jgi:AbrB family looped-hinge helix DNA binding protein
MSLNQSTVTKRGQIVIPSSVRKRYKINTGDTLMWIDDGNGLRVIVVPADPLKALYGIGKGEGLLNKLLEERKKERERDR